MKQIGIAWQVLFGVVAFLGLFLGVWAVAFALGGMAGAW